MNVVPLELMTQMMGQRINSAVYVVLLSEPMNFPLLVRHGKEMGDCMKQRKEYPTSPGIEPMTFGFDYLCSRSL